MSTMAKPTRNRRPRREFDEEFKAGAVRLVLDEGKTVGRVARDLDLTESALRIWVERARADRTKGRTGLTTEEREELRRLRKENRELRTEREILKKAAAFFAKHQACSSPGWLWRRPASRSGSCAERSPCRQAGSTRRSVARNRRMRSKTVGSACWCVRHLKGAASAMAARVSSRTCVSSGSR